MTTTITTYAQVEAIAKQAAKMTGKYEVRCLSLVVGRYATQKFACKMALKLQDQIDAPVTVH